MPQELSPAQPPPPAPWPELPAIAPALPLAPLLPPCPAPLPSDVSELLLEHAPTATPRQTKLTMWPRALTVLLRIGDLIEG